MLVSDQVASLAAALRNACCYIGRGGCGAGVPGHRPALVVPTSQPTLVQIASLGMVRMARHSDADTAYIGRHLGALQEPACTVVGQTIGQTPAVIFLQRGCHVPESTWEPHATRARMTCTSEGLP